MKTNNLSAEEIVSSLEGGWDTGGVLASVRNKILDRPSATVEAFRGNLGPAVAVVGGDVDLDRTLVGEVDYGVPAVVVVPFESYKQELVTTSGERRRRMKREKR